MTQQAQEIMDALNALVEKHPRWSFWMCFHRLRLMGDLWNRKRLYRVYKAMKLNLPRRKKQWVAQFYAQTLAFVWGPESRGGKWSG